MNAREQRERMVAEQIARRGVADPDVLHAMRVVPRHAFVPARLQNKAYTDRPLPIGYDQTISQPYVVAAMTEALRLAPGDRVLEVGTGSGYQAAVLAEIVTEVHTIELVEELAVRARDLLAAMHYRNVTVHTGDGALGWPAAAPYDAILVACGAPTVPPALVEQLAPEGRLIIPTGRAGHIMTLDLWRKQGSQLERQTLMQVRFVPLVRPPSTT